MHDEQQQFQYVAEMYKYECVHFWYFQWDNIVGKHVPHK